ncbi:MAG: hypothetical protein BHV94_02940 [Clostridiales bacterium 59_14]|nr:MAG: hypothetical protein BHV94_02940 [Clostridiales bacterium 59_14]
MSKFVNLEQIKVLANKVKSEDAALGTKLETVTTKVDNLVAAGGEANILEGVKVNGAALAISDKMVDILIASGEENGTISVNGAAVAIKGLAALAYKSEITEDELGEALKASIAAKAKAGYQTAEQVQAAIAASGHAHFEVAETDPTAEGFEAQANVMYLYMNSKTKHYDIYAKVGESVVLLDDTTVDLSEYAKTADMTSAISTAIAALNIDQYATDEDLAAAVGRVTALETAVANVYTKKEVDDKLAAKMNKADMDAYATDEEAQQAAATAVAGAQASDTEFNAAMNEVWTPTEG